MSQEINQDLSKSPKSTPEKLAQNGQSFPLKNVENSGGEKGCLRNFFDAKQRMKMDLTNNRASSKNENLQKSCIRKSVDTKQNERRVTFSSPIAREEDYFIFRSAKSFQRTLYPPPTHPCLVYMGTRMQQERQREQSTEAKMRPRSTATKEVK